MKTKKVNIRDLKPLWVASFIRRSFLSKLHKYDWVALESNLRKNGYNPKKYGFIQVDENNNVKDGNHRTILLKEIYHNNLEIEVKLYEPKPNKPKTIIRNVLAVVVALLFIWLIFKWWWLILVVFIAGGIMEYKNHRHHLK